VCLCVLMYVFEYICIYFHVRDYQYIHISPYMYIYTHVKAYAYMYVYVYTCLYMHSCIFCVRVDVCGCACLHIYTHRPSPYACVRHAVVLPCFCIQG